MADVMVLWYLMKPWEVVSQHLLEALCQGTQRCKAPSPKLECSCQHVNLLNTSAKIATNIVLGMVWMYFGCGHFYFSSFHSIYGRQTLRKHVHVCKSTKLLRQGCFTKTPNESATGTPSRRQGLKVLGLHSHHAAAQAPNSRACLKDMRGKLRSGQGKPPLSIFFPANEFYHHVGYKYNYLQYIHARKLFRQEKTNSVGGRKPK